MWISTIEKSFYKYRTHSVKSCSSIVPAAKKLKKFFHKVIITRTCIRTTFFKVFGLHELLRAAKVTLQWIRYASHAGPVLPKASKIIG